MNRNLKRNLLIIMSRAAVPIEFTSAYVLSMNLDSFVGVSKINFQFYDLLLAQLIDFIFGLNIFYF